MDATNPKVVYKITYPNGKIYVGLAYPKCVNYYGSANWRLIEADFSPEELADGKRSESDGE
jgi:hypothetical protein